MNELEEKIAEPFAVKILKSFYADTPMWAKSIMLSVAVFLGIFVSYVRENPAAIPVQYQKYVPGFCFVAMIVLHVIPVNKPTAQITEKESKFDKNSPPGHG